MVESFGSDDFKEGVKHFIEKRPANFTVSKLWLASWI